jgi:uncharacterized integral membrane protein (TIGR00698 family)
MTASPPGDGAGAQPAVGAPGPRDRVPIADAVARLAPGLALTLLVTAAALVVAAAEARVMGRVVVEALVAAILIGMAVRTLAPLPRSANAGVRFAARELLEVAVFLLGVSVDLPLLLRAGPSLALGIVLLVVLGLAVSYALGRSLGLPHKLAVLVACGNSICGNSAIAAVAPVIDAEPEHVVSSIAFTAIVGVAMVLALPLLMRPLGFSPYQYGVLAGLTVYAVPQVLAATFPVSALSGQVGTLVKLVRVLMLGPVVLFFALRHRAGLAAGGAGGSAPARVRIAQLVPWFIVGFLVLAALRSAGMIPMAVVAPARALSGWLTVIAMAALGLGCDVRAVARAGRPVVLTVVGSLVALVALSVALIHLLGIR